MFKREEDGKDDPIKKKALSAYNQKQEREKAKEAKIKEMAQRKQAAAMTIKKAKEARAFQEKILPSEQTAAQNPRIKKLKKKFSRKKMR